MIHFDNYRSFQSYNIKQYKIYKLYRIKAILGFFVIYFTPTSKINLKFIDHWHKLTNLNSVPDLAWLSHALPDHTFPFPAQLSHPKITLNYDFRNATQLAIIIIFSRLLNIHRFSKFLPNHRGVRRFWISQKSFFINRYLLKDC